MFPDGLCNLLIWNFSFRAGNDCSDISGLSLSNNMLICNIDIYKPILRMKARTMKLSIITLYLLCILFSGHQRIYGQSAYLSELNVDKWDVQPLDNSSNAANIVSFGKCHLAFFCEMNYEYHLYRSDSISKEWVQLKSPHEGKTVITKFINTDSNIFFLAYNDFYVYEYRIGKYENLNVNLVDSFVKSGNFSTFWTYSDPKSNFFVISIGLISIDSTYYFALNAKGINLIRRELHASSGIVNRDQIGRAHV